MNKGCLIVLTVIFIAQPAALLRAGGGAAAPQGAEATVSAEIVAYRAAIGEKAARGGKNVLFGWTEIPKSIVDTTKETNNPFWGVLSGVFHGTLKAMARTLSGASDVLTAPISADKDPLISPEIDLAAE